MALNQIEYNSVYVCHDLAFLVKSLHVFLLSHCALQGRDSFPAPSQGHTPSFYRGGFSAEALCRLGSKIVHFVVCTCAILCMPARTQTLLVKSLHDFCFPIALSREETVFWHPHRVTPLHFIEGGSLQKPGFVYLCWLVSEMFDFVVYPCTILCMSATAQTLLVKSLHVFAFPLQECCGCFSSLGVVCFLQEKIT